MRTIVSVVCGLLLAAIACSGGGEKTPAATTPTAPIPAPVATVQIASSASADSLFPSEGVLLSAVPKDAAGNSLLGRAIRWSIDDSLVASLTQDGRLVARALGATTARAAVDGVASSIQVTVRNVRVRTSILALPSTGLSWRDVNDALAGSISGTFAISSGGALHFIVTSTLNSRPPEVPILHLARNGVQWSFAEWVAEPATRSLGASAMLSSVDASFVIPDGGFELPSDTGGYIYVGRVSDGHLTLRPLDSRKSKYPDVSVGDINGDGRADVCTEAAGGLRCFLGQSDGTFTQHSGIPTPAPDTWLPSASLIANVTGTSRPQILSGQYARSGWPIRWGFNVFAYSDVTARYENIWTAGPIGLFANDNIGTVSMQTADFDKDGNIDVAIALETQNDTYLQIFLGDGRGHFTAGPTIGFPGSELVFRNFMIRDIDGDGYPDVVLNPFGGTRFYNHSKGFPDRGDGTRLESLVWKNTGGTFNPLQGTYLLTGVLPSYLRAYWIDDKLLFVGFETKQQEPNKITVHEIEVWYRR